jgi:hypothetical protein
VEAYASQNNYEYKFVSPQANLTHPSWTIDVLGVNGFDEIDVQLIDDNGTKTLYVRINAFANSTVITGDFKVSNGTINFGSAEANTKYDSIIVSNYNGIEYAPLFSQGFLPDVGIYEPWSNAEIYYSNTFSSNTTARGTANILNGEVVDITIDYEGFGYLTAPTVTIANVNANTYYGANAVASIADGQVTSITVTNTGLGYATAPTVTVANAIFNEFTANTTYANTVYKNSFEYITAQATSQVNSNGIVIGVTVTNEGFGYEVPPSITFEVPNSNLYITATGTTEIANGKVTVVNITNSGFGYTQGNGQMVINPPIYNTAEGIAVLNANGEVISITVTDAGRGYTSAPKVFITGDPIEGSLQTEEGQFFLHEESNTTNLSTDNDYAQNDKFQEIIDTPVTTKPNDDTTFIDFSERNPFSEGGEW